MEPISPGILINLAARGISGAVGALRKTKQGGAVDELVNRLQGADSDASKFVVAAWAKFRDKLTDSDIDCVARFLNSPEADVFARSLAISTLTRDLDHYRIELREELVALLALVGGLRLQKAEELRDGLYQLLAETADKVNAELRRCAQRKHGEIVDRAMLEKTAGYLRTIADRTIIFKRRHPAELLDILKFSERYKEQLRRRTSELIPAYFDVQQRAPIDSLYIQARLVSSRLDYEQAVEIDFIDLVEKQYRPVVLGDPGAGKSTLAQRIAHYYSDPANRSRPFRDIVPFIVPLRAYEVQKKTEHFSIPQYISSHITENYHIDVPGGAIEYILATRRGLVVFDGLDELLDIGRRQEICAAVESFSSLFSTAAIVATSRSIGYGEAPLKPSIFKTFELLPFSEHDVQHYARTWFALDDRLTPSEQDAISSAFLEESLSVPDLRRNALMLGLLCNVYRGIRQIPQNRADLYEKCATMLFERWDSERGIIRSGVLKSDARAALQDVALWIYTSNELADGVHERQLLYRMSKYWQRRYEDPADAMAAAKELLRAWTGRSWILTDVGSSAIARDRVYKFTHQTFLEYFASVELARTQASPTALWRVLESRLKSGSWEVVAQLAIQCLNDFQVDAGDLVVSALIKSVADARVRSRLNLLSFAVRNLDSLYVTTTTCQLLARASVDLCIIGVPAFAEMPREWDDYFRSIDFDDDDDLEFLGIFTGSDSDLEELLNPIDRLSLDVTDVARPLRDLSEIEGEYGRIACVAVTKYLSELMSDPADPEVGGKAFLMASGLHRLLPIYEASERDVSNSAVADRLLDLTGESRERLKGKILQWSQENFWIPIIACRLDFLNIADLLDLVNTQALMCSIGPFGESDTELFAEQILKVYLGLDANEISVDGLTCFAPEFVRRALHAVASRWNDGLGFGRDWLGHTDLFRYIDQSSGIDRTSSDKEARVKAEDDPQVAFGAFTLLAVFMELENWPLSSYTSNALRLGPIQSLQDVFIARKVPDLEPSARRAIAAAGFSTAQTALLIAWISGEVHFVD